MIIYEQPLNEKVRLFLRLEQLLERIEQHLQHTTQADTHAALLAVLDLVSLSMRMDVKSEVLKELDRQSLSIKNASNRRMISSDFDDDTLGNIQQAQAIIIERLHGIHGHFGQHLKSHAFINSLKQRSSLPGGVNSFDLPLYQYWLSRKVQTRIEDIRVWLEPFEVIKDAIDLILSLIRESKERRQVNARNGFYQQTLDYRHTYQLLRLEMPKQVSYYPEVSAGKQRFSIRFVSSHNMSERSKQHAKDVEFYLALCSF